MDSFDYIVVGAGSAACVLAHRLSTDPGNKVLLLEAGGRDLNPWLHNPAFDWRYLTESGPGIAERRLQWPRAEHLIRAATEIGIPYNEDCKGARQEVVGYFQQTAYQGFRWSTAKSFFTPCEKPAQPRSADMRAGST